MSEEALVRAAARALVRVLRTHRKLSAAWGHLSEESRETLLEQIEVALHDLLKQVRREGGPG